ncbi:MAG: STAS-like domain-containing protein [Nitrospinaceae bacterium]
MIGPRCVALDEGYRVYDLIFPELKNQRAVELDFEGVELMFSPFLMGAVGRLLAHFDKTTLLQRLIPCRISEDHLREFNEFLDRADRRESENSDHESMRDLFEEDELGDIS